MTLGGLQGIFYNAATTIKPTWTNYYAGSITPANSEDTQAFVYDNPFQIYRCASDDAVATTVTLGVLQGVFYNAATTIKPTWSNYFAGGITPANSEDIQAFVYDNPFQIYRCGTDDAVAATVVLAHEELFETFGFNTTSGSTATGKSNATLDIGSTHATNDTWKFLGSAEDPENDDLTAAYCSVNVIQNLNEIIDST